MLPAFQAVPRTIRLQADAANFRIQLFQSPGRADERATRTQRGDKVRDAPLRSFPNFVGRAVIVRLPVRRIAVLIRIEIFLRLGGGEFTNAANRAVGAFISGSHD